MLLSGYDLNKAAQVAAFFAMKEGGSINVLKLAKLLYLAERESMRLYDEPMFYDSLVSMPDGPVTSVTLNFINGNNTAEQWSYFVAPRAGYDVSLARSDFTLSDLDHLSPADRDILEALWARFGSYNQYELRDWTHEPDNIPEWQDPYGSSWPIGHVEVFRLLGKSDPNALGSDVEATRDIAKALAGD